MEQRTRKKLNNAGMSLVEIVVVVLILGILSAGAVLGFSYINQADASSTAEQITSLLDRTKLLRLATAEQTDDEANPKAIEVKLILSQEDGKYYATIVQEIDTVKTEIDKAEIGGNRLTLTVHNGAASTVIKDATTCEFTFQKSNGAFTSAYDKITVSSGDTCTVWLVNATGRSYIEYE